MQSRISFHFRDFSRAALSFARDVCLFHLPLHTFEVITHLRVLRVTLALDILRNHRKILFVRFCVFVSRERVERLSFRLCHSARVSKLRLERFLTRGQILHVFFEFFFVLCSRDERPFDLRLFEIGLFQLRFGYFNHLCRFGDRNFHALNFLFKFAFVRGGGKQRPLDLVLL